MADRRKNKYQEKPKPPVYYGTFDFDPQKITIKTVIPELPDKPKSKPDVKSHNKKIKQLEDKLDALKAQRKTKKSQYKKYGQGFEDESKRLEQNIQLGNKCIQVLECDIEEIENNIIDLQNKISDKNSLIRYLQKNPQEKADQKKPYQEMTYEQLQSQIDRLEIKVSTANLSKKQQTQINNLLNKLNRFKMKAPHATVTNNNKQKIQNIRQVIDRLKSIKKKQQSKVVLLKQKIDSINEDIEKFQDQFDDIQEKKKNPELEEIRQETNQMKEKIYGLRDQLAEIKKNFMEKQYEYDYQQKKIQWIKFASQTKQQRLAEWQTEKAERRKKKQYQQNKNKDGKQDEQPSQQKTYPQRPKFNRHQKQIDACNFLINYCEGLNNKTTKNQQTVKVQKNTDFDTVLKKGEWAKQKGIEVLKSKKAQGEAQTPKQDKVKRRKNKKLNQDENSYNKQNKFTHTIFIENIFDSMKTIAPTNEEELEKTIEDLKDKLEYYLAHPQAPTARQQKQKEGRRGYISQKYKKAVNNQNKKIINTQDFPALP